MHSGNNGIALKCPLCGSENGNVTQRFNSDSTATHVYGERHNPKGDLLSAHVKKLWGGDTCHFIKCFDCTLSYALPFISGDHFFYQTLYDDVLNYPAWKWEFETTINKIKSLEKHTSVKNLSLLEIGAGNGNFVSRASGSVVARENMLTTEYSLAGKEAIDALRIECVKKEIWDLCNERNKARFDYICMFQVLEHMDDFDRTFTALSYLCKPGGHLFIAVPSNIHREYFESIGYIEDVPPTHISRWSKQSFIHAAARFGWSLNEHQVEPNKLYKNLAKYLNFKYSSSGLVHRVNAIKSSNLRRAMKLTMYIPFLIINLGVVKPLSDKALGIVQWVDLEKHE